MTFAKVRLRDVATVGVAAQILTLVPLPSSAETPPLPPASPTGQLPLTGDVSVHDPTLAFDDVSGLYIVASTHNSIRTSPSMTGPWTNAGNVARADWTLEVPNSSTLWAPHLEKIGDTFYYYYSQSSFGSSNSAIGVKTTKTPAIPASYVDLGRPIVESGSLAAVAPSIDYNAIDPDLVEDADGTWWMVWGSFWDGIVVQQLGDDLVSVVGEPTLVASRQADDNPVEGPAIFYRDGFYYLVVSWDKCCSGAASTYKTAVGRSTTITGPYVDQNEVRLDEGGGTVILDTRQSAPGVTPAGLYRAPGGADVYSENGVDYLVYHAYLPNNTLGIRPFEWRDGWPSFGEVGGGNYDVADGSDIRLVSEAKSFTPPTIGRVAGPSTVFGTAVQLNGTSPVAYVDMPDGIVSELSEDFTISMWVKRGTTRGNDWARLFDFGSSTSNFMYFTPASTATPTGLRFDMTTTAAGGGFVPETGNSVSVSTAWTHVAVSASGTTAKIWVNGQVVRTNPNFTLRPADLGATVNNWIGRSQFSADPGLNAAVDDFNIFSRELSDSQMQELVAAPGGGEVGGGDVAWYRFDEAGGPQVADSSSAGNTATALVPVTSENELQNPVRGTQCLTAQSAGATQTACADGNQAQSWRLDQAPDGAFSLASRLGDGDTCLSLADASGSPGTRAVLETCSQTDTLQRWTIEDTGHGFLRFGNVATGLALQIDNDGGVIRTDIVGAKRAIRPIANLAPPQQWLLEHVDATAPEVSVTSPQDLTFDGHDANIVVTATDNRALATIAADVLKDGVVLASTKSDVTGTSATHTIDRSTVVDGGLTFGSYELTFSATDAAGNTSPTGSAEITIGDTTKPETTLVAPTTAGPLRALSLQVDATDDLGLRRIVANVYKDGKLVKSTQTSFAGETAASHTASVALADGTYQLRYNSQDQAGNISTTREFTVIVDATAPTVTVKRGETETVGTSDNYSLASFKLYDAGKIDRVELNGVVKDLTNNAWSDINFVKPGIFGAVAGSNTLVVYDVAGNSRSISFVLR